MNTIASPTNRECRAHDRQRFQIQTMAKWPKNRHQKIHVRFVLRTDGKHFSRTISVSNQSVSNRKNKFELINWSLVANGSNCVITICGNAMNINGYRRPNRLLNQAKRKFPTKPPAQINAAINDFSSTVNLTSNGVSSDDKYGKFGETHPQAIP